jgi:hypothetical protein
MQVEGLPDCWSPIVEDIEPTSKTIQKTRNMLVGCISLDDIRKNLLIQGLNDKQIFFAIEAGKILSRIVDICPCCNEDHSEGNSNSCDYEECSECGMDHEYEPFESQAWHRTHRI